jgi:hypothetical protein
VEDKLRVLSVQMAYVVANMDGVAPQPITVEMVARANVSQQLHLPIQPQPLPLVVVGMLAALSASLYTTNCLNITTMGAAPVMGSIPTMLSLLLPNLLVGLAPPVMLIPVRGSLQLSWLKLLMRLQVSLMEQNHFYFIVKILFLLTLFKILNEVTLDIFKSVIYNLNYEIGLF